MKKMIGFGAVALCAAVGFSETLVQAPEVVGYTSQELTSGRMNLFALPFADMNLDGNFDLTKNMSGDNFTATDDPAQNADSADQIKLWDPTGGTSGGYPAESSFCYAYFGDTPDMLPYNGWYVVGTWQQVGVDVWQSGIPAGTGFWYIKKAGAKNTLNLSGEVPTASTITRYAYQGRMNLLSCPYPIALELNNAEQIEFDKATPTDDPAQNADAADQIKLWDPNGGTSGGYPAESSFCLAYFGDTPDMIPYNGWYVVGTWQQVGVDTCLNGLPVNASFWYIARGTFAMENKVGLTFKSPVK